MNFTTTASRQQFYLGIKLNQVKPEPRISTVPNVQAQSLFTAFQLTNKSGWTTSERLRPFRRTHLYQVRSTSKCKKVSLLLEADSEHYKLQTCCCAPKQVGR